MDFNKRGKELYTELMSKGTKHLVWNGSDAETIFSFCLNCTSGGRMVYILLPQDKKAGAQAFFRFLDDVYKSHVVIISPKDNFKLESMISPCVIACDVSYIVERSDCQKIFDAMNDVQEDEDKTVVMTNISRRQNAFRRVIETEIPSGTSVSALAEKFLIGTIGFLMAANMIVYSYRSLFG